MAAYVSGVERLSGPATARARRRRRSSACPDELRARGTCAHMSGRAGVDPKTGAGPAATVRRADADADADVSGRRGRRLRSGMERTRALRRDPDLLLYNFMNRFVEGLGLTPIPEQFAMEGKLIKDGS